MIVSGSLKVVTDQPDRVRQVQLRAERRRVDGSGVVTTSSDTSDVENGEVSFPILPGPAVMTLMHLSGPGETWPILVPDRGEDGTATLAEVVEARHLADDTDQAVMDRLAFQVMQDRERAEQSVVDSREQAELAEGYAEDTAADAEATADDRRQTGADRVTTGEDVVDAGEWADYSESASILSIVSAATMSRYTGHGRPPFDLDAPVGSVYTDLEATTGAVLWVRTPGGWEAMWGDTGRRRYTDLPEGVSGAVNLRRVGRLVEMYADVTLTDWSSGDAFVTIPQGFRGPYTRYMPPGYNTPPNTVSYGDGRVTIFTNSGGTYRYLWTWITDDDWPTILPGEPR